MGELIKKVNGSLFGVVLESERMIHDDKYITNVQANQIIIIAATTTSASSERQKNIERHININVVFRLICTTNRHIVSAVPK